MGDIIKNAAIIVVGLVVGFIAFAYAFYFVGMTMSLAASPALGMQGEQLAQIFSWIGVGIAAAIFVIIVVIAIKEANDAKQAHITAEEFAEIFKDIEEEDN